MVFLALTRSYTIVVGTVFENGFNLRYRLPIELVSWCFLLTVAGRTLKGLRAARSSR